MEMDERQFAGKLHNIDLENLTKNDIKFLLDERIFIEVEYAQNPLLFNDEELKKDSTVFETFFVVNGKPYEVNTEILHEIYFTLKHMIEDLIVDYTWEINEILIDAEGHITKEARIHFLEEKHRELYAEVRTEPEFLVFLGLNEFNGFNSWEEMMVELLRDEYLFIQKYLKDVNLTHDLSNIQLLDKSIYESWQNYHKIQELSEACKRKLYEIKNFDNKSNLDASQKVILFENLMQFNGWADFSASKKSKIISLLIGSNEDNIKKHLLSANKPISQVKQKHHHDTQLIDDLLKNLG